MTRGDAALTASLKSMPILRPIPAARSVGSPLPHPAFESYLLAKKFAEPAAAIQKTALCIFCLA